MNTTTVNARTMWTVLVMELALASPLISLPTQGDRLTGLAGPFLILLLMPAGFAGIYYVRTLRDPSWRLLTGIGLALVTRAIVSQIPGAGPEGLLTWLARSIAPASIGVGLWWRGGALAVAEMTPADVRNEFSVVAVGLVVCLALMRPFLLPDRFLLGASVGLFAVAGLSGTALSRQDAAGQAGARLTAQWPLAALAGLLPALLALLLVGSLRPELLNAIWLLLARSIELLLTPLGLLLAWIGSLLPHGSPGLPAPPPPFVRPTGIDPTALAEAQSRLAWIGDVIVFTLIVAAGVALLLAARMLLANFVRDPARMARLERSRDVEVESEGTPADEAADLLGWLLGWLRSQLGRSRRDTSTVTRTEPAPRDAWAAYQRLLSWADAQGLGRRPAETTGQLSARLAAQRPDAMTVVDDVTRTFESERYGGVAPSADRLRRTREAVQSLLDR